MCKVVSGVAEVTATVAASSSMVAGVEGRSVRSAGTDGV